MCCLKLNLPRGSRRRESGRPSSKSFALVLVSSDLVYKYDAIFMNHGAHLLYPFFMALLHFAVLVKAIVRVEESQRVVLSVFVESG